MCGAGPDLVVICTPPVNMRVMAVTLCHVAACSALHLLALAKSPASCPLWGGMLRASILPSGSTLLEFC